MTDFDFLRALYAATAFSALALLGNVNFGKPPRSSDRVSLNGMADVRVLEMHYGRMDEN